MGAGAIQWPNSSSPMDSAPTVRSKPSKRFEKQVEELLAEDYEHVPNKLFFAARCMRQPIFSTQVHIGLNIYTTKRKVDFILHHHSKWPSSLVIQCKWQSTGGTTDEKFPFEVECINQGRFPTIIVLDGGGYRDGARQWLLGKRNEKLIDVVDMRGITQMHQQGVI